MRLIDADKLKTSFDMPKEYDEFAYHVSLPIIKATIDDAPTVDAVPVVRCKDCRWGREVCGNIECSADLNLPPEYHGYEWYCPNGERKEDETD